ncbi:MAG: TonB-dependent receptor [Gemmatimonadota bacterium]|nr:TonB-dependent receptor [Gemmatimonadota bacterium]
MTVAGLALLASVTLQSVQVSGSAALLGGTVRDAADGRPLGGAVVTLVGTSHSTTTDSTGRYRFRDVPPGVRRLRALRIDYRPLEIRLDVPDGGVIEVDFRLSVRPVSLPAVEARAAPDVEVDSLAQAPETAPIGTTVVRVLDAGPGVADGGIASAARYFLGPDPPTPDNVLFVRGAGATLDYVLLDGAPVQTPFHLGGLMQPSLPPPVQSARRMQGGASARWDGGLSDILLLESRAGRGHGGPRGMVFADLLSAGGLAEGGRPGGTSWLVSLRGLHGAASDPFLEQPFPQEYSDALGRLDIPAGGGDSVLVTAFWNEEEVFLDPADPEPDAPQWSNLAASLRFRGDLAIGRAELGAAHGRFRTRLPIGRETPLTADGQTSRTRLTADLQADWGRVRLLYGAQAEQLEVRTRFRSPAADSGGHVFEARQGTRATTLSSYAEARWPAGRSVHLSLGLRGSSFSGLGTGLSPRGQVDLFLGDEFLLGLSFGRYQQLVVTADPETAPVASIPTVEPTDPIEVAFSEIVRGTADQVVLSFARTGASGAEFRVDGYWKGIDGLPDFGGRRLHNAGADIWLRQAFGAFRVWGTWTLAWGWAAGPTGPAVELFSARHFLRGGVTKDFREDLRIDAELSFGDGLEFGSIPRVDRPADGPGPAAAGAPAARLASMVPGRGGVPGITDDPDGSYLRLNLQATGRVRVRLLGRRHVLFPYFRVVNALDRQDALFFRIDDPDDPTPRAVGAVPVLPVLGVEWHF